MLDTIIQLLIDFATWLVSLLPVADVGPLNEVTGNIGRLLAWVSKLDAAFPVTEGFVMLGIVFGVWFALYGVMLVRRAFSLLWPGAGS